MSDAKAALELFVEAPRERSLPDRDAWAAQCQQRKRTMLRRTSFDTIPIKPQRVFEEMNRAFGSDVRYVSTIGLSQIQAAQLLHVYRLRHWINAGQAGPLGCANARCGATLGRSPTDRAIRRRPASCRVCCWPLTSSRGR